MQAGLVSKPLTLSYIFTARGLSLRLFVAVVRVSVTSKNLPQPSCRRPPGHPIKERLPDQQRMAQAPTPRSRKGCCAAC